MFFFSLFFLVLLPPPALDLLIARLEACTDYGTDTDRVRDVEYRALSVTMPSFKIHKFSWDQVPNLQNTRLKLEKERAFFDDAIFLRLAPSGLGRCKRAP